MKENESIIYASYIPITLQCRIIKDQKSFDKANKEYIKKLNKLRKRLKDKLEG
jgi:hypothetical protein